MEEVDIASISHPRRHILRQHMGTCKKGSHGEREVLPFSQPYLFGLGHEEFNVFEGMCPPFHLVGERKSASRGTV